MKRIAASPLLETTVGAKRGVRRQENSARDDKLASLLSEIHAQYSGSLRAFFEDLESGSKKTTGNDRDARKGGLASTR